MDDLRRWSDARARCADLGERALAWIEDRLTQDFPVEIVERFAEVVDAIETEMSEWSAVWPDVAVDLLDRPRADRR